MPDPSSPVPPTPGSPSPEDEAARPDLMEHLRRDREWLFTLVGCLGDEVWLADRDGRCLIVNPAVAERQGLPAADPGPASRDPAQGFEVFTPDGSPRHERDSPLRRSLQGAVVVAERELALSHADGRLHVRETSSSPICDARGEIVGAVAVIRDVTRETALQSAVRQLQAERERQTVGRPGTARGPSDPLRRLAGEIAKAEQRERSRLAALLHDDLQQMLAAAHMHVEHARRHGKDPANDEVLAKALDLLERALHSTRNLSIDLHPPMLHRDGLGAVLQWLGGWMDTMYGLKVEVRLESPLDPLPEPLRIQIYQAVREMLFNVLKHAGLRQAVLQAARRDDQLRIVVSDLGEGFDPANLPAKATGCGLARIRERAGLLGGRLEIDSAPGRGTACTLVVPLA